MKAIVSPESPLPLAHFGCLIVNTALVAGTAGPTIKSRVQVFRQEMHARFVGALTRAKSSRKLKRGLNVDQCAEFLLSSVWGIFVTIRLADDDQSRREIVAEVTTAVAREHVEEWHVAAPIGDVRLELHCPIVASVSSR